MSGQWGGQGQCKAEKPVCLASEPPVSLRCDLDDNHPEIHWDKTFMVAWVDWTEEDEGHELTVLARASGPPTGRGFGS